MVDGIDTHVMRLQVDDIKSVYDNRLPGVFVIPDVYVGYQPRGDGNRGNLRVYKYVEVVQLVRLAFTGNVVQSAIDEGTTLIIAPDNWDRGIPARFNRFADQLHFLPFSLVLHKDVDSRAKLRKLVPPRNALEIIRSDSILVQLSKKDMLMSLPGNSYSDGPQLTPDKNVPDKFKDFNFTNQSVGKVIVNSRSGRRRTSTKKSKNSERSRSRSRSRSRNSLRKNSRGKKNKSKAISTKQAKKNSTQVKSYLAVMRAFKRNAH